MSAYLFFAKILKDADIDGTGLPNVQLSSDPKIGTLPTVLRLVFGIAGAIALLVITIAGFKYVISQGNPQEVAKAKDTILYALIGLAICILAFAIVGFVVGRL